MVDAVPTTEDKVYCEVHPSVETRLRCNKCNRPMCNKCAVKTPVGYRCKECVRGQQDKFYTANDAAPVVQFFVALPLSILAAILIGFLSNLIGFFYFAIIISLPASTFAGTYIAGLAHKASGSKRHRLSWIAVGVGMILGALFAAAIPLLLRLLFLPSFRLVGIGWLIYIVVATSAAINFMRGGKIKIPFSRR